MKNRVLVVTVCAVLLSAVLSFAQESAPAPAPYVKKKVQGMDARLHDIEAKAKAANNEEIVEDVRELIYHYETIVYRLVLRADKNYGKGEGFKLMRGNIEETRNRWLNQNRDKLQLSGTEVEKAFAMYRSYYKNKDEDLKIIEKTDTLLIFKRHDYVNAIAHMSENLSLDPVEVQNSIYAPPMTEIMNKLIPGIHYSYIKYDGDGWYEEKIEYSAPNQ